MDAYDDIKKSKKSPGRLVGLIFSLIGLVFLGVGGALTYSTYNFMDNALSTTGQVVNVSSDYSDGSTTYQPTFGYVGYDGEKHQGTTFLSSSSYNFRIGEKMEILYDTRDHSSVRLTGWFSTWGFGILFMGAGAIPLLIGLFIRKLSKPTTVKRIRRTNAESDERPEKYVTLESPESEEDHRRETEYNPTVRRR